MNINEINGNEIIGFLNDLDMNSDGLDDISICQPFTFENQTITQKGYELKFTGNYNNWGTYQEISDNLLIINSDGKVEFWLEEPFDGDGSGEKLDEVLTKWLENHTFDANYINHFNALVSLTNQILSKCEYGDSKAIDTAIKNLTKAKSLIK